MSVVNYYYDGYGTYKCGIVGGSSTTQSFYAKVTDVIKDDRPTKPRIPSNTYMRIHRDLRNTEYPVYRGTLYGTVAYTHNLQSYKTVTTQTDGNLAVTRAKRRLGQGELDLGTFIAELDDTVGMLGKTFNRIHAAYTALRKGNLKHVNNVLKVKPSRRSMARIKKALATKNVSSAWLEYSFGWAPLISDAYGAVEAYRNGIATRGASVSGSAGTRGERSPFGTGITTPLPFEGSRMADYAKFHGRVRNANVRTLQELGLINPILIAWNKLPYSFVVDWFIPIGDILSGLTANAGLTGVTGFRIREMRSYRLYTATGKWDYASQYVWRESVSVADYSIPLKVDLLSTWHFGTSLALVRQRLPRGAFLL